jgi:hypothetical protein
VRISNAVAKRVVEREHYLHTFPAARLSWGLYEGHQLLGVAVFGVPSHPAVVRNVFPDLQPFLNQGIPSTHWSCTLHRSPVGLPCDYGIDPLVAVLWATI